MRLMSRRRGREIHYRIPRSCSSVRMASVRLAENLLRSQTMRRDVGKATTRKVCKLTVVSLGRRANLGIQVEVDSEILIPRPREVIAEATRASHPCNLWCSRLSASHCGDIRARARELRCELWSFLSIIRLTRSSNPWIGNCQFQLYQMIPKKDDEDL
jgi:hypothetical protein